MFYNKMMKLGENVGNQKCSQLNFQKLQKMIHNINLKCIIKFKIWGVLNSNQNIHYLWEIFLIYYCIHFLINWYFMI